MSILPACGVGDESTGFYNDVATQSALFASNHYMTETPSSAGNRKQFTFSWWMKKHYGTGYSVLYSTAVSGSNSNSTLFHLYADNSNGVISAGGIDFAGYTLGVLRDTSNWYHCVVVVDTDQSSNNDRVKIYINGIKNSAMSGTCPQSNLAVNSTQTYHIGRRRINNDRYANIYLADFHLIDGTAISDTSRTNPSTGATEYVIDEFGEFNNDVWIPKAYSGSYGTNGFRMEFSGTGTSADSSGIGADTSGNNHHHAVTNFTANDSNIADSPENNFCTLNSLSAGDVNDMSKGNMQYADNRSGGTGQAKGTFPLESGKWYWEVHYDYDPGASNMIGIVAVDEITNSHTAQDPNSGFGTYFAWDERGYYYQATDGSHSNTSGKTSYSAGDIISFAMDVDAGKLFIRKNDGSFEDSGDPVNGTNPSFTFTANKVMTPLVNNYRSSRHVFNFGQNPSFSDDASITAGTQTDSGGVGLFKYAPPSGYLAICAKNLDDVTIGPSQSSQANDHFNTALYTGDGQTTQDVTGVGFKPDFTWVKERNSTSGNVLANSNVGYEYFLSSQSTQDESTGILNNNASRSNDGFQTTNSGASNESGKTYASWNWKANGGTLTTNDASVTGVGTIDSQYQVNTDAGFSIITYTGTGTAGTIAHGLGKTPALLLTKNRTWDNEFSAWLWWHHKRDNAFASSTNYAYLNLSSAGGTSTTSFYRGDQISSTVFGVYTNDAINDASYNYVTWAWAEIDGYSKMGTYFGNNSTDGTYVYTGFRPAWLIIKRTDSGQIGQWFIMDNRRIGYNGANYRLLADASNEEYTGTSSNIIDFLSNGFKCRTTSTNTNNGNYMYMAFAENPFKFTNAR